MDDSAGERLSGGGTGEVFRVGDTVLRESGAWTPAVHRLLRHLAAAGVRGVPRPLGHTDDGRERLSHVEGTVPTYPMPTWVWSESALRSAALLLRQVHDATQGFDVRGPWRSPVVEPAEVVCHNDFAPYNLVFDAGRVVGVIDWDFAAPGPRLWDLAYLAYRLVPITTAEDCGDGLSAEQRRGRLARLLRVYGTEAGPQEVLAVLHERLHALARHADDTAGRLRKPVLHEHAALYRRDAEHVLTAAAGGPRPPP